MGNSKDGWFFVAVIGGFAAFIITSIIWLSWDDYHNSKMVEANKQITQLEKDIQYLRNRYRVENLPDGRFFTMNAGNTWYQQHDDGAVTMVLPQVADALDRRVKAIAELKKKFGDDFDAREFLINMETGIRLAEYAQRKQQHEAIRKWSTDVDKYIDEKLVKLLDEKRKEMEREKAAKQEQ